MSSRAENLKRVQALKADGVSWRDIVARTGLSRSYVYGLLNDPDGSYDRRRKRKYDGVCVDCGGRTVGDGGTPPKRCQDCANEYNRLTARWTHETVTAAIQQWARLYGQPPSATNWNTAHKSHHGERARRFRSGDYPTTGTVQKVFGRWNAAIAAAGFEPKPARGLRGLSRIEYDRTVELYRQGLTLVAIADRLGNITPTGVRQRLKRMGIYAEPRTDQGSAMSAPLKAEQVIDREIERLEIRAGRLRTELNELEQTAERLRLARAALDGTNPNGTAGGDQPSKVVAGTIGA